MPLLRGSSAIDTGTAGPDLVRGSPDSLGAARGIALACLLALPFWGVVGIAIWWLTH